MKYFHHNLLIVITVLVFNSCKEEEKKKEEVLRPVNYQIVGTSDAQKIRSFSGVAKASDAIGLSFRSSGVITKVNFWKGAKVKKGDIIARLDNVEANLAYQQSVSALNSANSAMKTAKSSLDRVKSLYESGSQSLSDYEQAKNSYQSALDQYDTAKQNRNIQATQLSYGIIKAPKDGVIASTDGAVDERVSAGHQFAILNAGDDMKIEVGLPESLINKVAVGMETGLAFSAINEGNFNGVVIEVSPSIDTNSSTYITSIGIVEPSSDIKPGMAANVTFNFGTSDEVNDDTLVVPIKAIGEDGNGNFVFIIETEDGKTGTAKKQTIEIGELTSDGFKIKNGLNGGEKIATAGLQTLLDGQKVRLQ